MHASELDRLTEQLLTVAAVPAASVRAVLSPYRICPLGAHSDHQGGPVLGMAVSAYTYLAYAPRPCSEVMLTSENLPGEIRFDLARPAIPTEKGGGWGDYAQGAAYVLRDRLPAKPTGIFGRVSGSLPGGGLSSSASVILAYLLAFAEANGLHLEPRERVELALQAEKTYVGVMVGVLDPASIVGSRREHLLAIDSREVRWAPLRLGSDAPEYQILVAFAGTTRNLQVTGYNQRVEECFRAARKLADLAGRVEPKGLHDLPDSVFLEHADRLSPVEARRARHFFDERARVYQGIKLWQQGDLEAFGRLMKESCQSSVTNWESGSDELIEIQNILVGTPGVFGSRFSGAGFGGCCVALIDGNRSEAVGRAVQQSIASRLPSLEGQARVFLLESEDGVRML